MIALLTGPVVEVGLTEAVIEAGGIGYRLHLTAPHAASLIRGDNTVIHTILIVREDSHTIYGFASTEERTLFELLLTVTGVGPRHALAALSTFEVATLAHAIHSDDDRPFRQVPGIGPKTARMIVMSLHGKVTDLVAAAPSVSTPPGRRANTQTPAGSPAQAQAIEGLMSLGWPKKAVHTAIEAIYTDDPAADTMDTGPLIRAALARLG